MIRIAICDDEEIFAYKLKNAIKRCLEDKKNLYTISVYRSGRKLMDEGVGIAGYDVVFLDVNMDEINGMDVASYIRNLSDKVIIVFVTAYVDYMLEGYKYNAIRYILKESPNFQNVVTECMEAVIKRMNYQDIKKNFKFCEGEQTFSLERLLYIESRLHKLEFNIMEKNIKIYTMNKKMDDIDAEMQECGFVRLHKSFLVNMRHIKEVTRYKALLVNGQEIGIPKARYMRVRERFIGYKRGD